MLLSLRKIQSQNGKNLPNIIKYQFEMNISIIYLNNFYLYILSFKNKIKNKTTFKFIVSSIPLGNIILYNLLINFIIYSMILNLSKFDINQFEWGLGIGDWGLGIGDWAQSTIPNPQSPIPNPHEINISN